DILQAGSRRASCMTPLSGPDALIDATRQVLQQALLWREVAQALRSDNQELRHNVRRLLRANRQALERQAHLLAQLLPQYPRDASPAAILPEYEGTPALRTVDGFLRTASPTQSPF